MRAAWRALAVLCLANFLILLDTTIVNTAAPDIMADLGAGLDDVVWVLNGYLLAFAALLVVFGRVGDVVGPRAVFVAGLLVFTAASVLCGLSGTPGVLVAARVVQGVGAAALTPQALVLISAVFPADRRGAAFGVFTAVAGVAAVCGPTLGGLLVTEFGWPSVFYLNVPLGLLGAYLAVRFVPERRTARPHRFDVVGVVLATAALVALVFGLVEGQRHEWGTIAGPVTVPGVLALGVVLAVAFVRWERGRPEPLVPPALVRDPGYRVPVLITLLTSFSLYGLLLVFVLETQVLLGMSPLVSGVTALPWTVALSAVAPLGGRLADRLGGRVPLVVGLSVYGLGVLGVAFLPGADASSGAFLAPMAAVGVGMGLAIAPTTTEAMRGVAPEHTGAASGVLTTARQIGAALGAAVVGAVLQNRLADALRDGDPARDVRSALVTGFGARDEAFEAAFLGAARPALLVVAGSVFLGALLATRLRAPVRVGTPRG
ncbi:DHA2 family efflux MFS transporter permease subunit [Actinosynnema sp. NPDC047251]|uniref:Drug resistance transporter, EmrB/QacA subfamily n=1 Tax=Saccharothrix espanaensis (strain ATCC 51144 / DSM 44229 / JCM 9112 / NBRC 15066 / NRRL 15764) TaxID=1179773 RepID=K0JX36_SACES|nr:DHA2 family efflux MFS transporter permease subunit [Saccharothrix espanaensis]CCH30581.1 Drug resistance transporter, EmrB/QacA subfamily [Saccharothrix espanaensis DSM 44229]